MSADFNPSAATFTATSQTISHAGSAKTNPPEATSTATKKAQMQLLGRTNAIILALALPYAAAQTPATTTTASSTSATGTSGLPAAFPSCAVPALLASIQASGCQAIDAHCICSHPALLSTVMTAISTACDPADIAAVVAFAQTYCGTSILSGVASSTSAVLPSSVSAPLSTSTPAGPLVVDTMALSTGVSSTSSATTMNNYTRTMTYSTTATAKPTNGTHSGAAPQNHGQSFAAFAIAVGVIGLVFSEF